LLNVRRFDGFFRTNPGSHPGGFCFSSDSADGLAIHPEHPRNLALRLACIQQGLDRNPQIRLQDDHSRPFFAKRAQRNVPPPLFSSAPTGVDLRHQGGGF
jgi:hypothetical protein